MFKMKEGSEKGTKERGREGKMEELKGRKERRKEEGKEGVIEKGWKVRGKEGRKK